MPELRLNIAHITSHAPNTWIDIIFCYNRITSEFPKTEITIFESLPFVLQLGIFKIYFEENGIDIDFNNLNLEELALEIEQLILNHENVVKHYS